MNYLKAHKMSLLTVAALLEANLYIEQEEGVQSTSELNSLEELSKSMSISSVMLK
jgi:hypothetical protein